MNTISTSRLIALLSSFKGNEWRLFRRFIEAGLAGPVGKSLELFDYLSQSYSHFQGPMMEKETIYEFLFGKTAFDDKKLRYALTDLYRYACAFLKYRGLEEHPGEANFILASMMASRNVDKAYLSLYQSNDDALDINAIGFAEHYFHNYRKEFVHLNYFFPRQKRTEQNPIASVARNLDLFFISRKLQLLCEVVNVRNVMAVEYDFMLQDEIIRLVQHGQFDNVPVIVIYYRILMTLLHPDDESHFEILNSLLHEHADSFKKEEQHEMYQYTMNYCIKKINLGVTRYLSVLLEIYKTLLENKIIYAGEWLSQWDFKNIVVIGLRAGEKEWVRSFIDKYKPDLKEPERENAHVYNLAYFHFNNGDYRQALALLQKVEFTDLYYQLDMRAILLKCYFEMDDQEAFLYHTAAFRIFLSRNKLVSEYQRTIYSNMIKYTVKIIRAAGNQRKLIAIKNEIESVKQIADLNWLRKKAEQAVEVEN